MERSSGKSLPAAHSLRLLFGLAASVRILGAALLRTYANPDEYWQSPEIAHKLVYGVGYVTWEWWPANELRGAVHPLVIAGAYAIATFSARILHVPEYILVALAPKLLHALLAAVTDVSVYVIAHACMRASVGASHARAVAQAAFVAMLLNWFMFFMSGRAVSNQLESTLSTLGAAVWFHGQVSSKPQASETASQVTRGSGSSQLVAAFLAAVAINVRPSAAVLWAVFGVGYLFRNGLRTTLSCFAAFILPGALVGFGVSVACDAYLYGKLTFPLWSFINFNLFQGLDRLYGSYPLAWYLYDGIPVALSLSIPLALIGVVNVPHGAWALLVDILAAALAYICALSAASHKEHRFLTPVIPLLSIFAGVGWASLVSREWCQFFRKPVLGMAIALSVVAALYFTLVHQGGPVALSQHVAQLAHTATSQHAALATDVQSRDGKGSCNSLHASHPITCSVTSEGGSSLATVPESALLAVHFLMPCHSAPYYSVVHAPIHLLQLDCSPAGRLREAQQSGEVGELDMPTESTALRSQPRQLLSALYGGDPALPAACMYVPAPQRETPPHSGESSETTPIHMHSLWREDGRVGRGGEGPPERVIHYDDTTFATTSAAYMSLFAPAHLTPQPQHADYRDLPTHIAIFDTDAYRAPIAQFLITWQYKQVGEWFHAPVATDAHSKGHDPRAVFLFEHPCWTALQTARTTVGELE